MTATGTRSSRKRKIRADGRQKRMTATARLINYFKQSGGALTPRQRRRLRQKNRFEVTT